MLFSSLVFAAIPCPVRLCHVVRRRHCRFDARILHLVEDFETASMHLSRRWFSVEAKHPIPSWRADVPRYQLVKE